MRSNERKPGEPVWDFATRWCHTLRQLVRATTGEFDVDLGRYALVLTPGEYAELCDDRRALRLSLTPPGISPILYGIRIVVSD